MDRRAPLFSNQQLSKKENDKAQANMRTDPRAFVIAGNKILRRHDIFDYMSSEDRWGWTFNASPDICVIVWDKIEPEDNTPPVPSRSICSGGFST